MANADQEQLRAALAWASDDYDKAKAAGMNTLAWLWEVIQGDFNENASTAQALTAAGTAPCHWWGRSARCAT